jgi:hypothetical protein
MQIRLPKNEVIDGFFTARSISNPNFLRRDLSYNPFNLITVPAARHSIALFPSHITHKR